MLKLAVYKNTPCIVRTMGNEYCNIVLYKRQIKVSKFELHVPDNIRLLPIPFYKGREVYIVKQDKKTSKITCRLEDSTIIQVPQYELNWYVVNTKYYTSYYIRRIIHTYGLRNLKYESDKRVKSKKV